MRKKACQLVLAFALLGVLAGGAAAQTVAPELETTGVVARVMVVTRSAEPVVLSGGQYAD